MHIYRKRVRQKARESLKIGGSTFVTKGCHKDKKVRFPAIHKEGSMSPLNREAMYSKL